MPTNPTRLTPAREAGIRARLAARTPGKWDTDDRHRGMVYCDDSLGSMVANTASQYTMAISPSAEAANATFIANAPTDLADVLAEVEALRADAERWRTIRPALDVDGDVDHPDGGTHFQWVRVDEGRLCALTNAKGWTHSVESLVDAARATEAPTTESGGAHGAA